MWRHGLRKIDTNCGHHQKLYHGNVKICMFVAVGGSTRRSNAKMLLGRKRAFHVMSLDSPLIPLTWARREAWLSILVRNSSKSKALTPDLGNAVATYIVATSRRNCRRVQRPTVLCEPDKPDLVISSLQRLPDNTPSTMVCMTHLRRMVPWVREIMTWRFDILDKQLDRL